VALALALSLTVHSTGAAASATKAAASSTTAVCPSPEQSVLGGSLVVANGVATGTFTIAPGCSDVPVSLASYGSTSTAFALPQTMFDSATGLFDAGGPYVLTAAVPPCWYQVDLVRGPVIATLTASDLYLERKIAFANGGAACTSTTTTFPTPPQTVDVAISKIADKDSVTTGANVKYTITATNNGPGSADDVIVAEDLPAGMKLVSAVGSVGSCVGNAPVICSLGALAPGASAVITVEATATAPGTMVNTATVSTSSPDTNTANNTAHATVDVKAGVFTPPVACRVLTFTHRTFLSTKRSTFDVHVKDAAGKPVSNARVRLRGPGLALVQRTSTAGVAHFAVKPHSAGVIEVTLLQAGSCKRQSAVYQVLAAVAAQPSFTG
jgi:uncharacterized repeat protein (TIGR01451 family)